MPYGDPPLPTPTPEPPQEGWEAREYTYSTGQPHAVTSVINGQSSVFPLRGLRSGTYDENGNMTCRVEDNETFLQTYNAENRIASVQKLATGDCATPGNLAKKWDFAYDGDGVRTSTLYTPYVDGIPGTAVLTAYFMGGAYEVNGEAVRKYYSIAGMMIAMRDANGLKFILTDHLGSVLAITDDMGSILSEQRYLPFGEVRVDVGTIAQTDFGYTGQRALSMGLMDYKARFYDDNLGRFLQPDSLVPNPANPQDLNRFSYVNNMPINANDPTGHDLVDKIKEFKHRVGKHYWQEGGIAESWNETGKIPDLRPKLEEELATSNGDRGGEKPLSSLDFNGGIPPELLEFLKNNINFIWRDAPDALRFIWSTGARGTRILTIDEPHGGLVNYWHLNSDLKILSRINHYDVESALLKSIAAGTAIKSSITGFAQWVSSIGSSEFFPVIVPIKPIYDFMECNQGYCPVTT